MDVAGHVSCRVTKDLEEQFPIQAHSALCGEQGGEVYAVRDRASLLH